MAMRSGSIVLPEWQDDSEVDSCPICTRSFHFLFRKHHCRRCGRIICDQCSPHRITIPRQYIVRPPWESHRPQIAGGGGNEEEDLETSNPALGGGDTVRVCNPCVPDPNYGPPPQRGDAGTVEGSRAQLIERTIFNAPVYDYTQDPQRATSFQSLQRSPERTQPDRYRTTRDPTSPTRQQQATRSYYSRRTNSGTVPAHHVLDQRFRRRAEIAISDAHAPSEDSDDSPAAPGSRPIPGSALGGYPRPRIGTASGSAPPTYTRIFDSERVSAAYPRARPRPTGKRHASRPVREEDLCPVCGTQDPPFGPEGDQTLRESHIEDCINSHLQFSSPTRSSAGPQTHTDPAETAAREPDDGNIAEGDLQTRSIAGSSFVAARMPFLSSMSSSVASPSTPGPSRSPVGTPRRAGSMRTRPRAPTNQQRMLVYQATEKDCFDEAGHGQECIICFEDFVVGEEMGRLECLCKFHRMCIRAWWESASGSGAPGSKWGSCPTHTLQT